MMTDDRGQRLVDAVADATRCGLGKMSAAQLDHGWERLERALDAGQGGRTARPSPRRWLRRFAAVAALLVLGLAGYRLMPDRRTAPLHYAVEGARVGADQAVTAASSEPAKLVFSDRSEIQAAPSSKLWVRSLDARGARVSLANGELDVRVEHRQHTAWQFEAGPFTVWVRGTAFRLTYDAQRGRFAVQMLSGLVEVRGPAADRMFTLRAGESIELYAEPERKPAAVEPTARIEPTPAKPPEPAPARLGPPTARRRVVPAERSENGSDAESWGRLMAHGEFTAVVRRAEARGIDTVLASASAADLTALADAARYTRRGDVARQALLGLRARFPGTTRASDAAFFLGRLAEAPASTAGAALSWYEAYLRESPSGAYAAEALGREIVLLARTDPQRARQIARAYLERFPKGTQTELAKSLLEAPGDR